MYLKFSYDVFVLNIYYYEPGILSKLCQNMGNVRPSMVAIRQNMMTWQKHSCKYTWTRITANLNANSFLLYVKINRTEAYYITTSKLNRARNHCNLGENRINDNYVKNIHYVFESLKDIGCYWVNFYKTNHQAIGYR